MTQDRGGTSLVLGCKQVTLTLTAPHTPWTHYQTRSGLHVWGDFAERIVAEAMPIAAGTGYRLATSDLIRRAADEEIEAELPKYHVFDESAICAIVANLISKQPKGRIGDLEHTGKVNLLYAPTCAVHVYWNAEDGSWRVGTWDRGDSQGWAAGARVFFPWNVVQLHPG
jgi:hypothetical protein